MLGASKKVFLPTKNLCFFLLWFLPWNCSVALLQVVISALPTIIKRHFTIDIQNYIIGTIYFLHRFFCCFFFCQHYKCKISSDFRYHHHRCHTRCHCLLPRQRSQAIWGRTIHDNLTKYKEDHWEWRDRENWFLVKIGQIWWLIKKHIKKISSLVEISVKP